MFIILKGVRFSEVIRMKSTGVVLATVMTLISLTASAGTVSVFEGGSPEAPTVLKDPARSSIVNISLPVECHVKEATVSVSAVLPGQNGSKSPENVQLFLGNDPLWAFGGKDYGAFGTQDKFVNGTGLWKSTFGAGGGSNTTFLRLPEKAAVKSAVLETGCEGPVTVQECLDMAGAAQGDGFGVSVAGAGDVNKDGFGDIIVGAHYNDAGGTDAGRAYIFSGGKTLDRNPDVTMTGVAARDYFGISVAGAGDVNGDGYDDVIVGADRNDAGGADAGRAYIFFGGSSMDGTADIILTGSLAQDNFGRAVAGAGDVDKDGYSDVIIGSSSRAYIFRGGANMDSTADTTLYGEGGDFGFSVSGAGDVNNDGYDDVVVGAPLYRYDSRGRMYVYFGGASMDDRPDVIDTGKTAGADFGRSVSGAGDVNNDGYDDVLVGARYAGTPGVSDGEAYIYLGGATMDGTADVTLAGALYDSLGASVSGAGDVNDDGYDDVVVGAESKKTYVYYGGAAMDGYPDWNFSGAHIVAGAGDIDKDGYDDVISGFPDNNTGGAGTGSAHLFKAFAGIKGVSVAIGTLSVWKNNLFFSGTNRSGDFGAGLADIVRNAPLAGKDKYGNGYVDLAVKVSAASQGTVRLGNLTITYTLESAVPDFAAALNSYISAHRAEKDAAGNLTVPLRVSSGTPGNLKLTGLKIVIDEAPRQVQPVPDLLLPEDTARSDILDLHRYFEDDFDLIGQVNFSIASVTNGTVVKVELQENRYLSADASDGAANDNWTGEVAVVVSASDSWGSTRLSGPIRIMVTEVNDAPVITSSPPLNATGGLEYRYNVEATDAENDPLRFKLARGPVDMTIDAKTGLVRWIPSKWGVHIVAVTASDGSLSASQSFSITVANRQPRLTDTTRPVARTNEPFSYVVPATDDDGDPLTFSLVNAVDGMAIDPSTGKLTWTPKQVGETTVGIGISDGQDNVTVQLVITVMQGNRLPAFTTSPVLSAYKGVQYNYEARANDMDNDILTFQAIAVPTGMAIDGRTGVLSWTPPKAGSYTVKIGVSDGKGGLAVQEFNLTVKERVKAIVEITAPQENQKVRGKLAVAGTATRGTLAVVRVQLRFDSGEWGNATGNLSWQYSIDTARLGNGRHVLQARAYDGMDYSSVASRNVTVDNQNAGGKGFIPGFGPAALAAIALVVAAEVVRKSRVRGGRS
jgi:hypothetical protein